MRTLAINGKVHENDVPGQDDVSLAAWGGTVGKEYRKAPAGNADTSLLSRQCLLVVTVEPVELKE